MAGALDIASLATGATPAGVGIGLLQAGIGIVGDITNKANQKKYLNQLKAYKTPQEVFDIYNMAKNNASQGYDATTLDFLTNQIDQTFSSSLGTATRLGADPNDLSSIFQQKINSIMKVGSDNHLLNMQNFDTVIKGAGLVADNRAAEFKSQQDIIKNKLQATGVNLATATGNISGGLNTILSTLTSSQIANMYNPDGTLKTQKKRIDPITGLAVDSTNQSPSAQARYIRGATDFV